MNKNLKKKLKMFPMVNLVIFLVIVLVTIIPILKIFVDSIDATASYGINLWPKKPTLNGYKVILSTVALYKPFLVSVFVTVVGTCFGLIISTFAGYVLMQFEMPGRTFISYMLLFTMIFQGGMVPTYLAMKDFNLLNTLWAVILPASLNVYNTILMRNFFEGIPKVYLKLLQ